MPAKNDLVDLVGGKSKLAAHLSEQFDVAAAAPAKRKAFAQIDLAGVQTVANYLAQKSLGGQGCKFTIEMNNDCLVQSEHFEIGEPLVKGRVYMIGAPGVRSAKGEALVHTTGAYTLHEIPTGKD